MCKKCGFDNPKENLFCEKCGTELSFEEEPKTTKEQVKKSNAFRVVSVGLIIVLLCTSLVFFIQWKDTERFLNNERARNANTNSVNTGITQNNSPKIGDRIRLTTANYSEYCSITETKSEYNQTIGLEIKGAGNFYSFCEVSMELSVVKTYKFNNETKTATLKIHIDLDIGGNADYNLSKWIDSSQSFSSWKLESITGTVCRQI